MAVALAATGALLTTGAGAFVVTGALLAAGAGAGADLATGLGAAALPVVGPLVMTTRTMIGGAVVGGAVVGTVVVGGAVATAVSVTTGVLGGLDDIAPAMTSAALTLNPVARMRPPVAA